MTITGRSKEIVVSPGGSGTSFSGASFRDGGGAFTVPGGGSEQVDPGSAVYDTDAYIGDGGSTVSVAGLDYLTSQVFCAPFTGLYRTILSAGVVASGMTTSTDIGPQVYITDDTPIQSEAVAFQMELVAGVVSTIGLGGAVSKVYVLTAGDYIALAGSAPDQIDGTADVGVNCWEIQYLGPTP